MSDSSGKMGNASTSRNVNSTLGTAASMCVGDSLDFWQLSIVVNLPCASKYVVDDVLGADVCDLLFGGSR